MRLRSDQKIFGTLTSAEFIGRTHELGSLSAHALDGRPSGLALLATPGAGSSELLRQTYDRLFIDQSDVIPFYFAVRDTDEGPRAAALRFVRDLLTQTVAFRRRDPAILDASPEMHELAELAAPADGYWVDRLVESYYSDAENADDRSFVRSMLSAPLRAAATGARVFVMIDDLHDAALMPGGTAFFDELCEIYDRSALGHVFAGARRFLFGTMPVETLSLEPLGFEDAGRLAESLAARYGVAINDQTRDLIAAQFGGIPARMNALFASAAARAVSFESFRNVERVYSDEIFGGRISRSFDALLERLVPYHARANAVRLLGETLDAAAGKTPLAYWTRHLGLSGEDFRSVMDLLNTHELISVNSGSVHAEASDRVMSDYLRGRARLETPGENRALVVGEASTEYVKRAPQILARLYRRNSALGLRPLLAAFDCQQIPAAAMDYAKFKDELKGLDEAAIETALKGSTEKVTLPQIVYAAHTAAFYSKIGELIDDERSTVAVGFEDSNCRDETVWITAEIDSKLEAARDQTEYWCDRLEMVAVTCGFANYKLWLVAPEGFTDDATEALRSRGALGSSRRQVEWLIHRLLGGDIAAPANAADEYEMVIPMGEDTELIAAHAVEEIAKRHAIPAKTINQIKTALVEACINATEHSLSPDRRIYQKFSFNENKITVTVSNRGLRLADKTAREIAPDEGRRGWGLKLMRGLMDEVKIEQADDGTRVTMVKYLAS